MLKNLKEKLSWLMLYGALLGSTLSSNAAQVFIATDRILDLAIEGRGFFSLRRPEDNVMFATRAGHFTVDAAGFIVAFNGLRLQGFGDWTLNTVTDLRFDSDTRPATVSLSSEPVDMAIDNLGRINITLADTSRYVRGQVLLQDFGTSDALGNIDGVLYRVTVESKPLMQLSIPLNNGLGRILSRNLEVIDVSPTISAQVLDPFAQRPINRTGGPLDLAILGEGYLVVKETSPGPLFATRKGNFTVSEDGFLVTDSGLRLQGVLISNAGGLSDIQIDMASWTLPGESPPTLVNFWITGAGRIEAELSDTRRVVIGDVVLQRFEKPNLLRPTKEALYSNLEAAVPIGRPVLAGTAGVGTIIVGALEDLKPHSALWMTLRANGKLGSKYTVEMSRDFGNWSHLATIVFSGYSGADTLDKQAIPDSSRYYRMRLER
jgi:flagellar hook protein FlgE